MNKIFFDETTASIVFDAFDKVVDPEGYLIDKSDSERVISSDGQELQAGKLAAIKKGSQVFVKEDLVSLIGLKKMIKG